MLIEGKVGPQVLTDGASPVLRAGRDGALVTQAGHAVYQEAVLRGRCFAASVGAAGVDHGAALGTTPPFTLYNPLASGVNLVVLTSMMGYISGTLGAGVVVYAVNTAPGAVPPTGGTELTPGNLLLGKPRGIGKAYTGATVPATATIFYAAFNLMPVLATSAVSPWRAQDHVDGMIVVGEGCCLSLQGIAGAAGTAPKVVLGMTWEEVPV